MKHDAWVTPGEPIDHRGNEACGERRDAPDPHFSSGGIGEKLDVLHALSQVVKNRHSAIEQRPTIFGRLDPLAVAIQQSHAERMLKVCNRSRNVWLRAVEELRCLAHAAGFQNGHQDVQVLQFHPASDTIAQLHGSTHSRIEMIS